LRSICLNLVPAGEKHQICASNLQSSTAAEAHYAQPTNSCMSCR
jgi:hypothetical protein